MSSKRERSHSPVEHKDGHTKESEISRRKDNSRDQDKESSHARPGRDHELVRHSDRHSYGATRESRSHDDHRRYRDKRADDIVRSHPRTYRSDRESRTESYYDRSKRDNAYDRSCGERRNGDGRYGDNSVKQEQRSKNQEKKECPREFSRFEIGEYNKYEDLRNQTYSSRRYPEGKESKNKEIAKQEEAPKKRNAKEIETNSSITEPEMETREKRRSLFSSMGPDVENAENMEMLDSTGKKLSFDCSGDGKTNLNPTEGLDSSTSESKKEGIINSVNAAKVAAMKAAELVNRNIVGFGAGVGRLSTEQKKKLLWGNKKSNPSETSTHWDSNLFPDRERQEKFNKLMSLRMPWWLWPIVGCEEQHLHPGSGKQGGPQGGELRGCQETGGSRDRPGEALHSRPAPERWSNRWSWPVGNSAYRFYSIEGLRCLLCTHPIGLFIFPFGSPLTACFASPVELDYHRLVAPKRLCLLESCIVRCLLETCNKEYSCVTLLLD